MPGPVIGASHTMPLLISLNFWFLKLTTGGSLVLAGGQGVMETIRLGSGSGPNLHLGSMFN